MKKAPEVQSTGHYLLHKHNFYRIVTKAAASGQPSVHIIQHFFSFALDISIYPSPRVTFPEGLHEPVIVGRSVAIVCMHDGPIKASLAWIFNICFCYYLFPQPLRETCTRACTDSVRSPSFRSSYCCAIGCSCPQGTSPSSTTNRGVIQQKAYTRRRRTDGPKEEQKINILLRFGVVDWLEMSGGSHGDYRSSSQVIIFTHNNTNDRRRRKNMIMEA